MCRTTIRSTSIEPGLEETAFYDPANFTYPAGAYACEVEVDPETGRVEVVAFSAADDFGNVINPMIVEGQVHGGLAQGIGQALMEAAVYDENGQLQTGSYMDYAMPRAGICRVIRSISPASRPARTIRWGSRAAARRGRSARRRRWSTR